MIKGEGNSFARVMAGRGLSELNFLKKMKLPKFEKLVKNIDRLNLNMILLQDSKISWNGLILFLFKKYSFL